MKWVRWIAVAMALAPLAAQAQAQVSGHPATRPIWIIAPYAPGGGVDVYARILAQELTAIFEGDEIPRRSFQVAVAGGDELAKRILPVDRHQPVAQLVILIY